MKNSMNGRDFITIGIFNAIAIVIYMAIAIALVMTVAGGFIASGVAFAAAAPVYLLMGVKIKKRGVFTISGILLGLIALAGGHIPHALFAVLGGFICDLIIGKYDSRNRIVIGFGVFALADYIGTVLPVILFGTAVFLKRAEKWNMSKEQIDFALEYLTGPWTIAFGIITFALGCVGAYIATKILKKHFEKAGVI
jgi:energy-coupling factor transport system substrate-specific component